jgi:hypothetical protein
VFLTFLAILHVYWLGLMLGMLKNYVVRGVREDTQNLIKAKTAPTATGGPVKFEKKE